jgi:membrane protease YdiL (CAAX protease family)
MRVSDATAPAIPAAVIIHQEGAIALMALIGLSLRGDGVLAGLAPSTSLLTALGGGIAIGVASFVVLWVLRGLRPAADLESWQRRMVRGWSITDAIAVALFSGLAEEALIRALLQPLLGLWPAALLFAALHFVPDRRLWLWPILALILGLVLGWTFALWGYPAAAAAHITINILSLLRLRTPMADESAPSAETR